MERSNRLHLLLLTLVSSVLLAVLHFSIIYAGFYDSVLWVDIFPHFLGGVAVGFGLLWAVRALGFRALSVLSRHEGTALLLAFVAVAVLWEVFEYSAGLPQDPHYALDTAIDLAVGTLGALFAWVLAHRYVIP